VVYVKRNREGLICAVFGEKTEGATEEIDVTSAEFLDFLMRYDHKAKDLQFLESDLQLIRVIEDLIAILIDKHVITITDFPQFAIDKLLSRQAIRKKYASSAGMEFSGDDQET
jgi:hypothetical protein